jgi:hypothetical protein
MEYLAFKRAGGFHMPGVLPSGQLILCGNVPAVLDGHLRSARRRFRKVIKSEITDGEEA